MTLSMDRFGSELLMMFLETNFPEQSDGPREYASWEDVSKIMFQVTKMAQAIIGESEIEWSNEAIEELDRWLIERSQSTEYIGETVVSPLLATELLRRSKYATVAASLEKEKGPDLMLPLPLSAPDELKGFALMLYILGGPARNYPAEMFD